MLSDVMADGSIQRFLQRLALVKPVEVEGGAGAKLAAVAVIVRLVREPEVLFIKRADVVGDPWSGHVAFPGGRFEESDGSLEATAVRETLEELSLDIGLHGRVVGRLDDLAPQSPRLPPVVVRPFVVLVEGGVEMVRNREVADVFWVPVSELGSEGARWEERVEVGGVVARFPAYRVGGNVIWGLTERIVRQLLPLFR